MVEGLLVSLNRTVESGFILIQLWLFDYPVQWQLLLLFNRCSPSPLLPDNAYYDGQLVTIAWLTTLLYASLSIGIFNTARISISGGLYEQQLFAGLSTCLYGSNQINFN
jgi:hypothetical protein